MTYFDHKDFSPAELDRENERLLKTLLIATNPGSLKTREVDEEGIIKPLDKEESIEFGWDPVEREPYQRSITSISELFGPDYEDTDWAQEFWDSYILKKRAAIEFETKEKVPSLPSTVNRYKGRIKEIRRLVESAVERERKKRLEKNLRKRKHVYQEILTTERTYIRSLKLFMQSYIMPMEALVSRELFQQSRQAVRNILDINEPILEKLETIFKRARNGEPEGVEDVFIANAQVFKLYVQYVERYGKILKDVNELTETNEKFSSFAKSVHEFLKEKGERATTIKSFLIMPVQRLPRYKLLLGELLKKTPPHMESFEKIKTALGKINEMADYVNIKKKEIFNSLQARELYKRFKLKDLVHPSRKLLMFTECIIDGSEGSECYIFNDLIAFVRKNKLYRVEVDDKAARCYGEKENKLSLVMESERFEIKCKFPEEKLCKQYIDRISEILTVQGGNPGEVREMYNGWLRKEGGGNFSRGLKKRYHMISSDKKVKYFKKKGGKMNGSYSLDGAYFGISKGKVYKHGFYIRTVKRTYFLKAESENEMHDWLTVLEIVGCRREKN